jgi:hypothetical protein
MFSLAKMITCRNTVRLLPNLRLHDPSRHHPSDLLGLAATPVLDDICFAPTKPSEETLRKLALGKRCSVGTLTVHATVGRSWRRSKASARRCGRPASS